MKLVAITAIAICTAALATPMPKQGAIIETHNGTINTNTTILTIITNTTTLETVRPADPFNGTLDTTNMTLFIDERGYWEDRENLNFERCEKKGGDWTVVCCKGNNWGGRSHKNGNCRYASERDGRPVCLDKHRRDGPLCCRYEDVHGATAYGDCWPTW